MTNLTKMALVRKLTAELKADGYSPEPGNHEVNETVVLTVKGNINKLADETYVPTVDIPMLPTLALVLEKCGFMREKVKDLLIESMTEALVVGEKGSEHVAERVKDIEAAMEHVRDVTGALPVKSRQGKAFVTATVTPWEPQTV